MNFSGIRHYLTGIAVPVSALRTPSGCGTGEFSDLADLVPWCTACGIELVQILPVNDTGFESSPYGALSAYALHPLYIRLQGLPEAHDFAAEIAALAGNLNNAPRLAFRQVLAAKLDMLKAVYTAHEGEIAADGGLASWIDGNPWIVPYAVYSFLREANGHRSWRDWPEHRDPQPGELDRIWNEGENRSGLLFYAWVQCRLEEQLAAASRAFAEAGIILKGDLPILMNDDSADVWANRRFFDDSRSAGAPPDGFSPTGQNWGFPIYNWDALRAADYGWWKERLAQAAKFYGAFRIDHVLGFFRIWATPRSHETASLGSFIPAETVSGEELESLGFDEGRIRWLSEPHLRTDAVNGALAASPADAGTVFSAVLTRIGSEELWLFRPEIRGGRDLRRLQIAGTTLDFLAARYRDRALIQVRPGRYAFTHGFRDSAAWKSLSDGERRTLADLATRKGKASEETWETTGRELLSVLSAATGMLPCAEDLGAIPDCVPRVLADLGILGLRVNRWARKWNEPGSPFIPLEELPVLSVCTPSVHDTSTLRQWWEEEDDKYPFWNEIIRRHAAGRQTAANPSADRQPAVGPCPASYSPETARTVIDAIADRAASVICVFQIQDALDLDGRFCTLPLASERINVPGTWNETNWSYRMPCTLAELAGNTGLVATIAGITAKRRGRPVPPEFLARLSRRGTAGSSATTTPPATGTGTSAAPGGAPGKTKGRGRREFHISALSRKKYGVSESLFELDGNVILADFRAVRLLAQSINEKREAAIHPERAVKAGQLNAMGLIDETMHVVVRLFRDQKAPDAFARAAARIEKRIGRPALDLVLERFVETFPPKTVYFGGTAPADYLAGSTDGTPNREVALEELMMLFLENDDPAFGPFADLFDDSALGTETAYAAVVRELKGTFEELPPFGPEGKSLYEMLKAPVYHAPHSLPGQLEYIRTRWGALLGPYLVRLLSSLDLIREEEKPSFPGPGPTRVLVYAGLENEYERFTRDKDWMPKVVLIAKSTLVWLSQLSRTYARQITRLDQIPDEELDTIASRGFNALWLIGLWERSTASRRIKEKCGNPEAAASAYSLFDYDIAGELGGWDALRSLKERCAWRGIRLAADMVPNHTGIDSRWVREHPDWFMQLPYAPFPGYSFGGEDLSGDGSVCIQLEDHYYNRTDAAVVFKRLDKRTGDTRFIYHGNDGTSMPWNDTAQIDFLNPEAREAVIRKIIEVAKVFPVIRFDAAMVLARKHIRRLWYPEPGSGGAIASRSEHALAPDEFDRRMPNEFWREVVDRCAREAPECLLLAEAFWMLEGYFVRTLGMHRVYNSAFMNMLKREENEKYRSTIKNTMEFDPEVLKRFVNFMNNPDEDTAVAQFGKGDKYFGVCTMMVTMPGLPMFGHGQVEGFEEKYGMEYRRAYRDEVPDGSLIDRHYREIFPLMKKRYLFAGVTNFLLYDFWADGHVNENVFAYSNREGDESVLVLYNNAYERAAGWIRTSAAFAQKSPEGKKRLVQKSLGEGLHLTDEQDRFLIFREQRAGLWFIRPSAEVYEKGLFAELNGYQSQIFLDIQEVQDTVQGQYRTLATALGGRGVVDIQDALQDIALGELYAVLTAAFTPEFFEKARGIAAGLLAPGKSRAGSRRNAVPELIADLRPKLQAFFTTAVRFLQGTEQYAAFSLKARPKNTPEAACAGIEAALTGLYAVLGICGKNAAAPGVSSFSAELARGIQEKPATLDLYVSWAFLANLAPLIGEEADRNDARRLIDHWCIDRKLREVLQEAGHPGDIAYRDMAIIKTLMALSEQPTKQAAARRTGARKAAPARRRIMTADDLVTAVGRAVSDEEVRKLIGVNTYNDVVWFNKELFDLTVFHAAAGVMLDVPYPLAASRMKARVDELDEGVARIRAAETASGYRLDSLRELLNDDQA